MAIRNLSKRPNPQINKNQFKRKLTTTVQKILSGEISDKPHLVKKDAWGYNGDYDYNVYKSTLENKHIFHLKKIKNKNPKILILGPGEGKDIRYLIADAKSEHISPIINVFGLTKITDHSPAYSYINKDYSIGVPFEHLDPKIKEHRKIFEENIGKNDLIIALMSTSYHTQSLSFSLYQSAIMLSKGGKAYLQYNYTDVSQKIINRLRAQKIYENQSDDYIIKNHFGKVFNKLVNHFNRKYNKNYKFKIDWQPLDFFQYGYIEIERIN